MKHDQLARTSLVWQILAIVLPVLPHLTHLPVWVPVLLLVCIGWRTMVFLGRWSFPKWYVRVALVILAAMSVFLSYKTGSGISSTVALLVTGFGLKSLEMYKKRDALVIVYVAYLVAATAFLFDQSILMAIYIWIVLLVCTTSLLAVNIRREVNFAEPFKRTFFLTLPAIPLMIVLFLIVPRIGPLWQVGLDTAAAKTGLSDEMSPGDITRLTRSAETAFRVSFSEGPPEQKNLYWRAIVMNDFDGRTWSNQLPPKATTQILTTSEVQGEDLVYEVILEASDRSYIPVLEQLSAIPAGLLFYNDSTLSAPQKLRQRKQFNLISKLQKTHNNPATTFDLSRQLALPKGNNRAKQLARKWWQETGDLNSYVERILQHYNRSFIYTLQPEALGTDPIDQFLFDTQQGFCGHFSSATAFMLRAVGVPARIVTGYQGGEWNPFENYLLVRQYDAHAWVEYWMEGTGWTRIDPTAFVAPERVEQPSDELFSREEQFLVDNPFLSNAILNKGWLAAARLRLEALNYGWQRWVLGYHNQQHSFLSDLLGKLTYLKLALFLFIPFVVVIAATTLMILRSNRSVFLDPSDQLIMKLSQRLSQQGLQRKPGETVQNYCLRVAEVREELANPLQKIGHRYEQIRYAGDDSKEQQKELFALVKHCCEKI